MKKTCECCPECMGIMGIMGILIVLVLIGQYLIYRNQMKLNTMMSEGFMQIKENNKLEKPIVPNQNINEEGREVMPK